MGEAFAWRMEVFAGTLHLSETPEKGEEARSRFLTLDEIDFIEIERRYMARSPGAAVSFRRFRSIWEGESNRDSMIPRARIAAVRDVKGAFFIPSSDSSVYRSLAAVWTLGADTDFRTLSDGDILVEMLLDMGATLLLVKMWQLLLDFITNRACSANLHVARVVHPDDPALIRSIFDLYDIRAMKGVYLNPQGLIVPPKSRCALVTLGSLPTEDFFPSHCSPCRGAECVYSQMDLCPHTL